MVLCITNQCFFECPHCMRNSHRNGKHMTKETFEDSLKFIEKYKPNVLIVSGGEPTIHPEFCKFIDKIANKFLNSMIIIASNGWFLTQDGKIPSSFKFNQNNIIWQISNDKRYYNICINAIKDTNEYCYIDEIEILQRCSKMPSIESIAQCINIRFNHGFIQNFKELSRFKCFNDIVIFSESILKFCKPLIDYKGDVFIGETDLCKPIGNIYSTDEELLQGIYKPCNNCNGQQLGLQKMYEKY